MKIFFTDMVGVAEEYYISPAIKNIPGWYFSSSFYLSGKKEIIGMSNSHTIKKCMPLFDSMTAGYIIKTYVDIFISHNENGEVYYQWPDFSPIEFHKKEQLQNYPLEIKDGIPKWINPWSISTPKGYSCLFVPPMHHENNFFNILPGIVDTDNFNIPVNFPFTLKNKSWEGIIPAGTPMAQVIPFKRDSFEMKISANNKKNEKKISDQIIKMRSVWFNGYKRKFWNKKQYF